MLASELSASSLSGVCLPAGYRSSTNRSVGWQDGAEPSASSPTARDHSKRWRGATCTDATWQFVGCRARITAVSAVHVHAQRRCRSGYYDAEPQRPARSRPGPRGAFPMSRFSPGALVHAYAWQWANFPTAGSHSACRPSDLSPSVERHRSCPLYRALRRR